VDRLLQDPRVDPAADDSYAIRRAAARRHWSVVARLLACRPGLPAVLALTLGGFMADRELTTALRQAALGRRAHLVNAVSRRRREAEYRLAPSS